MIDELYGALVGLDAPGASEPWPVGPLGDSDWRALVERSAAQRLLGTLADAVGRDLIATKDAQFAELARRHEEAMITAITIERLMLDVCGCLRDANVAHIVLKGPAIAHTLYRNPSQRQFIDLDVLVDDIDRAVTALEAIGARRKTGELRPGYDRRFGKAVTMAAASGTEIDVHRTLAPGPYGLLIEPADLFRRVRQVTIGGRAVPVLERDAQFLHSCYHVALGAAEPRGSNLRDIALGLSDPALDRERVLAIARSWQGEAVLATAILACVRTVPMQATPLSEWARSYDISRRDRALLDAYGTEGSRFAKLSLASLRTLKGVDRLRFVRALALPRAASLESRSLGRRAHLAHLARRLRRLVARK